MPLKGITNSHKMNGTGGRDAAKKTGWEDHTSKMPHILDRRQHTSYSIPHCILLSAPAAFLVYNNGF